MPPGGNDQPVLGSKEKDTSQPYATPAEGAAEAVPKKLRILLVEDHAPTLAILSLLLERSGYDIETADSVAEALNHVAGREFDLLISDLSLPDGNGSELLREIRRRSFAFPAIAMTGYSEETDFSSTEAAGFCLHLVKPIDLPELKEAIEEATSK